MMHMSRFSEELVLWASAQFQFVDLPDRFCTGSSIMPQKKNPDVPELVRGKTGRVYGHMISLLTLMKSQPLAYNKDNQEDKEPLFDLKNHQTDLKIDAMFFSCTDDKLSVLGDEFHSKKHNMANNNALFDKLTEQEEISLDEKRFDLLQLSPDNAGR